VQLKIFSILLGLAIISIYVPAAYSDTVVGIDTRCFERDTDLPSPPDPPGTPECDEGTGLDKDASLVDLLNDFGIGVCDMGADPDCDEKETVAQLFTIPAFPPPPDTDPPTPPTTMGDFTVKALADTGAFGYFFFACFF